MKGLRRIIELAVTKQDYFHQLHSAEPDFSDPTKSYYYDLRARVSYSGAFDGSLPVIDYGGLQFTNPIHAAQYGLGHLQRYWDSQDDVWLDRGVAIAHELVSVGTVEGFSLVWRYPLEIRSTRNWLSAMAQGQVASFLLRAARLTDDASLMKAARDALEPYFLDISEGGVQTKLGGSVWLEEYAFEPIPFTLNGYIVALLGLYDAVHLIHASDERYKTLLEQGLLTLERVLPLFDAGGWSRYDLSRREVAGLSLQNLASPFYHRFHLELLDIMFRLTGNVAFRDRRRRWKRALIEGPAFYIATAEKIAFRALSGAPFAGVTIRARPGTSAYGNEARTDS